MATLTDADIKRPSQREYITSLEDTDVFVVEDVSEQKIKPITKANAKATLGITDAEGTLADHETRLNTLEGTGAGSVAKAIDDAVSPVQAEVDNNRLYSDSQYLALKAKADSLQVKCNTLQAEVYTDDPILQYGATEIIGKGYEADDTPIDVSANVVDGSLELEQKGLTITNSVINGDFSQGTTAWFGLNSLRSVTNKIISNLGDGTSISPALYTDTKLQLVSAGKYYFECKVRVTNSDCVQLRLRAYGTVVNGTLEVIKSVNNPIQNQWYILSGIFTQTNQTGNVRLFVYHVYEDAATANGKVMEVDGNYGVSAYNLTALGLSTITDTAILAKLLPYVGGTQNVPKLGLQILDADDNVTQTIFLPAIGNRVPNGVADSIKTVADGWEHTKRVSTPVSVASGVAVNTTNYPTAKNAGQWVNELTAGGTEIGVVGTDSTTGAGMLRFELATPIVTKYDLPLPTSGKTIHRFAGEEKIALYGTGVTFSENVLSVLSAVKFVAGVMTDITDDATITGGTVTFSGVGATDVVFAQVEHDVDKPLGVLEHTPAVSNTASRLASLEARVSALEV